MLVLEKSGNGIYLIHHLPPADKRTTLRIQRQHKIVDKELEGNLRTFLAVFGEYGIEYGRGL